MLAVCKKKAFTLIELLAVIVIIGILSVVTYHSFEKSVDNQKLDSAEGDLRSFNQSFCSYFIDYDKIEIDDTLSDALYEAKVNEIIDIFNRQYSPCELILKEIYSDNTGFTCETKIKKDPWDMKYRVHVSTKGYTGSPAGVIVVESSGKDRVSSFSTYASGNTGDDVIVIIEPKGRE